MVIECPSKLVENIYEKKTYYYIKNKPIGGMIEEKIKVY